MKTSSGLLWENSERKSFLTGKLPIKWKMWCLVTFLITHAFAASVKSPFLYGDEYLTKEYINAITAYGPGLGVFTPYSYVDISYDNIPFVGKIPLMGKEGTSSKLGISPFYPPQGNPSNPFPPLYRARPLPLHVPEPQDVVAVPLDEEALHGEPLFPPELVLPFEQKSGENEIMNAKPADPFVSSAELTQKDGLVKWPLDKTGPDGLVEWPMAKTGPDGLVEWPMAKTGPLRNEKEGQQKNKGNMGEIIVDKVLEKSLMQDEVAAIKPSTIGRPKNPFRSKRIKRQLLLLF